MNAPSCAVLIVEDDRDIRQAFAQTLAEEGYASAQARHGREALDMLRRGTAPRLILLDLMMPVMDGWQFRAEQRGDPDLATIPVVVVSADASAEDRLVTMGVAGFLRKPVMFDDLMATVRRFCDES
ncbi:MAG TPA: response regulator [Minicystis sp.]|nr:response regulator [Minicystis sp.]